ncbi:helix-turn-helix transcriptional regulator [Longispora sp. NPDC051575]|uniref:helix-turn-helix transcriptional regulator n=1 Tax=Longispora sp. NPDC051575 TaxID=3154943 RepID=UPI00342C2B8C
MVRADLRGAATEAKTMPELGEALSACLQGSVPHDGYVLVGLDPATGTGCLLTRRDCYSPGARLRIRIADAGGVGPHRSPGPFGGGSPVEVTGSGFVDERHSDYLHGLMAAEGFGAEMYLTLAERGVPRGRLFLLRERGRRPFSAQEADVANRLAGELAAAVRCFVAGRLLRPGAPAGPHGVVLVGADNRIRAATPAGNQWLDVLRRETGARGDDEVCTLVLTVALPARREPALTRVPTSLGWVTMSAQAIDGTADVAVTLGPTGGTMLLPALVGWYRITAREQAVVEQALLGLPVKQIARRLDLSPYTVNDHLRAVYRKTGVTSREELVTALAS